MHRLPYCYRWERIEGNKATGEYTEPRPYYVNNRQLGSLGAHSNPAYFDDNQLYNLSKDKNEDTNIFGQEPAATEILKKRLAKYLNDFPDRPFREFSETHREYSPPTAVAPPTTDSL